MYYFGTNLDARFNVPDFWPTAEQSHKIPYDKADIKKEVERYQLQMRDVAERRKRAEQLERGKMEEEKAGQDEVA